MRRPSLLVLVLLALGALVAPLLAGSPGAAAAPAATAAPVVAKAKKAPVASSVQQRQNGSLQGRLTSQRSSCVDRRRIYVLVENVDAPAPYDGSYSIGYLTETDGQGRWSYDVNRLARRFGVAPTSYKIAAYTLGSTRCGIAQSPFIRYQEPQRERSRAAAGRARVSISLTVPGGVPQGRISSSKASCEKRREVYLFYRPAGSTDPFQAQLYAISRRNGTWEAAVQRLRLAGGDTYETIAATRGNADCLPAQSRLVTFQA